jgi:hypothetical protein
MGAGRYSVLEPAKDRGSGAEFSQKSPFAGGTSGLNWQHSHTVLRSEGLNYGAVAGCQCLIYITFVRLESLTYVSPWKQKTEIE